MKESSFVTRDRNCPCVPGYYVIGASLSGEAQFSSPDYRTFGGEAEPLTVSATRGKLTVCY